MTISMNDARFRRAALLALVLIAIALTIHEIFGNRGYFALRRRRQELQSLEQQVQKLKQENQQLELDIKALKSDPKAIERLAREQMKLAKPGEIIYVLPEKKEPPSQTPEQPKEPTK
ncbi:MAG: septum formation initiator family protein [Acidobacteria bacterium]|nr:septum formation initiator family protein [Acidobacteriota bacterium]